MKRGGYIKRKAPIKRGGRIRPKQTRRVARKTDEEMAFTSWCHAPGRRCAARATVPHECQGPIQMAHPRNLDGPTGTGRKEADLLALPLCMWIHQALDQHKGPFTGWSREQRKLWWMERSIEVIAEWKAGASRAGS